MNDPQDARKREMERIIQEDLEEDLLRCSSCGDRACLGLCEDVEGPDTELPAYF